MSDFDPWDEDTNDFAVVAAAAVDFAHDSLTDHGDQDVSKESTRSSDPLCSGMSDTLLRAGIGEIGHGSVVEVHPSGQWLGLDIPFGSNDFILLRPTSFIAKAEVSEP